MQPKYFIFRIRTDGSLLITQNWNLTIFVAEICFTTLVARIGLWIFRGTYLLIKYISKRYYISKLLWMFSYDVIFVKKHFKNNKYFFLLPIWCKVELTNSGAQANVKILSPNSVFMYVWHTLSMWKDNIKSFLSRYLNAYWLSLLSGVGSSTFIEKKGTYLVKS